MYLLSFHDIVGFGPDVPARRCRMMNVGVDMGKRVEARLAVRVGIVRVNCDQRQKVVEPKYPRSHWITYQYNSDSHPSKQFQAR